MGGKARVPWESKGLASSTCSNKNDVEDGTVAAAAADDDAETDAEFCGWNEAAAAVSRREVVVVRLQRDPVPTTAADEINE